MSLAMLFIFMACAVFGIVTGVGLLRLKNWARISALVWSGITVFFAGFALLLSLIIPMPPPRNAPDFTIYLVRAALFLIYGLPCGIGTCWLVLFTRKPVVAQFVASMPEPLAPASARSPYPSLPAAPARPGLPVPLAVFATFLVISSPLSILFLLGSHLPAIFLGVAIRGGASTVFLRTRLLALTDQRHRLIQTPEMELPARFGNTSVRSGKRGDQLFQPPACGLAARDPVATHLCIHST